MQGQDPVSRAAANLKGKGRGSTQAFDSEAVRRRAYNTYNAYNQLYNLYNECTCCLCLCLGLRLVGSKQHGTGSDKGVFAGRPRPPPPGGPIRSTGKNTRKNTSAIWAFVLYGKNAIDHL
jgi:hypothetical protein